MKKILLVLSMVSCIFCMTGCGNKEEASSFMTEAEAIENGEYYVEAVNEIAITNTADQYVDYPVVAKAVESFNSASTDMGDYIGIESSKATLEEEEVIVYVTINGSKRDAVVELIFGKEDIVSITTNVEFGFSEQMGKAGLNTLLGMGTVFAVLILISLIIGCFGFIPKIQKSFADKNKKEESVDNIIAQIIEKEEGELFDDFELVAVISAAIAASEGAGSTDGFVVRSIKRANTNKWQKA